jgi:hypothetical protein
VRSGPGLCAAQGLSDPTNDQSVDIDGGLRARICCCHAEILNVFWENQSSMTSIASYLEQYLKIYKIFRRKLPKKVKKIKKYIKIRTLSSQSQLSLQIVDPLLRSPFLVHRRLKVQHQIATQSTVFGQVLVNDQRKLDLPIGVVDAVADFESRLSLPTVGLARNGRHLVGVRHLGALVHRHVELGYDAAVFLVVLLAQHAHSFQIFEIREVRFDRRHRDGWVGLVGFGFLQFWLIVALGMVGCADQAVVHQGRTLGIGGLHLCRLLGR